MSKYGKKLLSALLVIAMVASLLVIPAGAEVTTTTTYDFQSDEFRACGVGESAGAFTWTTSTGNVEGTSAFIQSGNGYGVLLNNGGSLTIPVAGNCNIAVTYKMRSHLVLGDQAAGEELESSGDTATATVRYTDWADGTESVTLTSTGGQSYILSIAVGPLTEPDPELKLDKNAVQVKVDDETTATATVTAQVLNGTATAWDVEVTADPAGAATAAVDATGKVTVTAVAEGTATVTVKATVDGADDPLTADIAVTVLPAGEVVYTSWDFTTGTWPDEGAKKYEGTSGTLRGLEIDATASSAKFNLAGLPTSWAQFNKDTIVKVPVDVPEGKKALVSVKAYAANTISVEGVPNQKGGAAEEFVCLGEDGWVTIKGLGGQGYLASIAVEYGEGELVSVVNLDKDYLGLQMGETESGEITVTKIHSDAAVKATSADETVAKATVDGDKVTITAQGAGETTVDISLDGVTETALNKKTVTVEVGAAGQVYYIEEGAYDFSKYTPDNISSIKGLDTHGAAPQVASTSHGLQEPGAGAGTSGTATGEIKLTVNIPEGKTADLVFVTCTYGIGTELILDSDKGTVSKETTSVDSATGLQFTVAGASGETTLTFHIPEGKDPEGNDWNKGIWIHTMTVLFGAEKESDRKIDVWDLTGQVVTGDKYNNNITPELWKEKGYAVSGVLSNGTEATFGDFTLIHNTNDRLYSGVANAADFGASATAGYGVWEFEDGYKPNGGVYCNGTGSATARYMQVKNVFPGDKLVAYLGSAQNGAVVITFEGLGGAAGQEKESHEIAVSTYDKLEFVAQETGTYKIWASGGGKPFYQRVMRYPGVPVAGTITLPSGYDGAADYGIKFVNTTTKAATVAKVKNNQFEVTLAPGYEYSAIMTGASGWGFTVDTKKVTAAEDGGVGEGAGMTHNMTVEAKETYTFSGSFVGFADGYDISKLAVDLIPEEGSGSDEARLEVTGKSFTATLDPEVVYTLVLSGVNDYVIKTPLTISSDKDDVTQDITMEAKELYTASGKFVIYDVDDQFAPLYADSTFEALPATVTKLSFKNVEDGYTYDATVSGGGYTVNLRAGAYEAVATVDGWSTKGHVVVVDKAVEKDLMFAPKAAPAGVDYAADVYVGDASKSPNFKTVTGAMAYVKRMTRTDDQRVTVHIAPGTYTEQISIDSKNVTFVNDTPSKEVKLTWYYGIGYAYYSTTGKSGTDSWYDVELAFDKYNKPAVGVARWGCTVRVQAPGFRAQDITFENSFNYYLTEEEIVDGVECTKTTIDFDREYGVDVTSKAATERAAAIWVDTNSGRGDMTEFKNCKFLSSQDTFGTGSRMYLKDCYIEGMTDYICGPGDCVFDTCTLNWKGYSDKAQVAYLTAPQTGASEKGYLFRNCYISGDTKLKIVPNHLGRTWGAANTKCIFLNTTLQSDKMIDNTTWIEMQGFNPANSTTLLEWGTTLLDGTAVDLSKRTLQNTVAKSEPTAKPTDYFGGWTPYYYVEEAETVTFEVEPAITDNGDINTPYPGHTLTVNYSLGEANDANDASVIQWVRVADDGAETVVKTSKANADKTYKITKDDQGAIIKVTVTPTTLSGKTGESKSIALENKIREGFEDPTGATDPELGDGVNVFLAGDSTVFDYSNGRNEGSWGEFLQNYLDKEKVTVVDHAVGGRSSRSFINEGRLDTIAANIKEGDFLLIQFGHNDCANEEAYRAERYAPLGAPDASGKYPTTAGTKGSDGKYTWDNGGTYKWYLQQYIDVAKNAGATPILVTPVARLYYTADGTIRPHHDESYATNGSLDVSKWDTAKDNTKYNNAYVTAVKQLAEENGIACIDAFQFTKDLYEDAYKACQDSDKTTYGRQVMHSGDSTHSNKLGGMIQAAMMAKAIKDLDVSISKTVKAPTMAQAKTTDGKSVFTVDGKGVFTAYDMLKDYGQTAPYWMGVGQDLMDALEGSTTPDNPDNPSKPDTKALADAIKAAKTEASNVVVSEDGTDVSTKKLWVTQSVMDALEDAIKDAEEVANNASATEAQIAEAKTALDNAVKTFVAAQKEGGRKAISGGGSPTPPVSTTPATTTVTNPDGSVATATTDKDGNVDITVKAEDGEVLAEVKLPATISAPATKFIDVPEGHWAEQSINNMAGLGMVKGVSENTYDMVSPITRSAVATIFYRLSNGAEGKTATFADVPADAWYADAVGWAANAKLINGYNEISFGPEDTITRQQMATMIARYARLLGMDTGANAAALDAFVDGAAADDWAVASLAWCVKNGVMKGRGGDVLDPTAAVTRAEAAVMIDRMIGLIK